MTVPDDVTHRPPTTPPPQRAFAPWTNDEVESLYGFQRCGYWHDFTCPQCGSTLIPRTQGWICWRNHYTQDWAHKFMTDWTWRRSDHDVLHQRT